MRQGLSPRKVKECAMSMLDELGVHTKGLITTQTPFESWKDSPVKDWSITMKMVTMGDMIDIAQLAGNANPVEATYLSKVCLLAKSLVTINGTAVVTDEDIEAYNKEHNLTGTHKIDLFDYKVLFIRKWTESIVNRLAFMYDELQDEYLAQHLGKSLPDELKAATVSGVDLSTTASPIEESPDGTVSGGDKSNT